MDGDIGSYMPVPGDHKIQMCHQKSGAGAGAIPFTRICEGQELSFQERGSSGVGGQG